MTAYAVDLELLKSVLGSKDEALLSRLMAAYSADLAQLDEWFEDDIEDGAPSSGQALKELVSGDAPKSVSGVAQYGYALEILCRGIGQVMYPAHLTQLSTDWLAGRSGLDQLGTSPGPLLGLVPIPFDFPGVGCVAPDEVESRIAEGRAAAAVATDVGTRECYAEYIGWLEAARKKGVALLSFLY